MGSAMLFSQADILQKPPVASEALHTMGTSLGNYLLMKVHPSIQTQCWEKIVVKGDHQRDLSKIIIASNEKGGKPFNWMRPTVSLVSPETLHLHVFPGQDYVKHYAAIIATYLHLRGDNSDVVSYVSPSYDKCSTVFANSNLRHVPTAHIFVLGYVEGLSRFTEDDWEKGEKDELFSWKFFTSKQGYRVAFLGCRICYWGDIGGKLVQRLHQLHGAKCVFYVGKLGSLRAEHIPNRTLATGSQSLVDGEMVSWKNPLQPYLHNAPSVVTGVHCCLGSVLEETKEWLSSNEKRVDFVDPEIGRMAKASRDEGLQFGYLHIISDNLAQKYDRDLSNERNLDVGQNRKRLMTEVQNVFEQFFDEWSPHTV